MSEAPDVRYGRVLEGAHLVGYTASRMQETIIGLLESGDWKQVGAGFNHPNEFMRSIDLSSYNIEDRASLVTALKEAAPELSNRALAAALGVDPETVNRDVRAANAADIDSESIDSQQDTLDIAANAAPDIEPEPAETPDLPSGQYRCLVIDPPWPMKKIVREVRPNQKEHLDYPTLTVPEIQELVGGVLAEQENCHVYLWVTQKFMPEGLRLFEAWGVKYQCLMTWVKNVGPTPFSWMYDTEHVIFGQRGSVALQEKGLRLSFTAKTEGHSIKPAVFYQRVIAASPGPRLAMFERGVRDGFAVWGDEVAA